MTILLIGATGYIGSAVAEHLRAAGHQVVGLSSSGGDRTGDLKDPDSLTRAVTPDIDAVINLAPPTGEASVDAAAMAALAEPLRGTGKALVYTSGIWVLGPTGDEPVDESAPVNPLPIVGYRPAIEQQVLATADDGVRAVVIRPGIVHGRGGGIPAMLVDFARENGAPTYVADASIRWPMVHIDDLAELFVIAIEKAPAGTLWHGVAETAVCVGDLAASAAKAAGVTGPPRAWPQNEAREALGAPFADALALDQSVSGLAAQDQLGWTPSRPGAVADLRSDSYRRFEVYGAQQDGEVNDIVALVAELERAQQNEDVEAFMRQFRTADPVWTTAHGKRLSGWETINAFTRQVLPGAMKESTARYRVARILFLRPDVAVVNARQEPITLDGRPLAGQPEGRPLYVLAKEDGIWKIAAAQNTQLKG